jgi:hypothetical protein
LAELGYTPINSLPDAFAAHLQTELSKWKAIVRDGKIKPE